MEEIRVTRQVFDRYWREANADRLPHITEGEAERLRSYHWALLLAARLDEEMEALTKRRERF